MIASCDARTSGDGRGALGRGNTAGGRVRERLVFIIGCPGVVVRNGGCRMGSVVGSFLGWKRVREVLSDCVCYMACYMVLRLCGSQGKRNVGMSLLLSNVPSIYADAR